MEFTHMKTGLRYDILAVQDGYKFIIISFYDRVLKQSLEITRKELQESNRLTDFGINSVLNEICSIRLEEKFGQSRRLD